MKLYNVKDYGAIADGVTDAAWDQYLNDLKSYGYYEWLQWYQDFADGII